jgi:hypothetical protein
MVKCANCENNAIYTCADPGVNPVNYCADCLPHWLYKRAELGHFPLVTAEVKETKSSKKKAAAEEEPANENN